MEIMCIEVLKLDFFYPEEISPQGWDALSHGDHAFPAS